jgi:flagellar motor component MotA
MKLRFFMGIGFVIAAFVAAILLSGNYLGYYFDPFSLMIAIIFPHVLISFMTPLSEQKKMISLILSQEPSGEKTIHRAISFLSALKRMIICSSLGSIMLGTIGVLAHLGDTSKVGPNSAVVLITIFYAALYILAVIEPLRMAAEKSLVD